MFVWQHLCRVENGGNHQGSGRRRNRIRPAHELAKQAVRIYSNQRCNFRNSSEAKAKTEIELRIVRCKWELKRRKRSPRSSRVMVSPASTRTTVRWDQPLFDSRCVNLIGSARFSRGIRTFPFRAEPVEFRSPSQRTYPYQLIPI